jgi:hypothetical protein
MSLHLDAWEVGERGAVRAHHGAGGSPRSSGDDQVVRSARPALVSDVNEQLGVYPSHRAVVVDDGDHGQDVIEKGESSRSEFSRREEHADPQLRRGDSGDRHLVVVTDGIVQVDF